MYDQPIYTLKQSKLCNFIGYKPFAGLEFIINRYFAYFNRTNNERDYLPEYGYLSVDLNLIEAGLEKQYNQLWDRQQDITKAYINIRGLVLYNDIIAIDTIGEQTLINSLHDTSTPIIYVNFNNTQGPFKQESIELFSTEGKFLCKPDLSKRIKYFKK